MQEGQSCGQGIGESGTGPRSCTESKRTTTLSGLILCPIPTNPYSSYNPGPLLFHHVPEVTQVEAHCNQTPYVHYRQQQPQSIKSRMLSVLNPVSHQDMGKFCSQVLTRSMVRKSEVAVPCPVTRKVRPPLAFANAETSMGRGRPCFEGTIPLASPGTSSYITVLTALFC